MLDGQKRKDRRQYTVCTASLCVLLAALCPAALPLSLMQVSKWRAAAQRHEAALAEATAKLHTREAQSLAATTQAEVCVLLPWGCLQCCFTPGCRSRL